MIIDKTRLRLAPASLLLALLLTIAVPAIFAKSVMKTSSIAKAETTNLPVTTKAMATKAAFRMVRLILLMIHVRMRW